MRAFSYSSQYGFSMIESMIAALIIAIGLLGVAGMQIVAMKGTNHSVQQGKASDLMQGLLERMRSNSKGVYDENYNIVNSSTYKCNVTLAKDCEDGVTLCNAKELAKSDLYHTICGEGTSHTGGLIATLSNPSLSVSCIAGVGKCSSGINLKIKWQERLLGKEGSGNKTLPREISLDTVIAQ